jgi:phosphotriesterase-related protein
MTNDLTSKLRSMSRRELLTVLAAGAGVGVASLLHAKAGESVGPWLKAPSPKPVVFPKGAIIRTLTKDVAPGELGNGAILFHEHMSYTNEFLAMFRNERPGAPPVPPPTEPYFMQNMDLMVGEMKAALEDGVSCLVNGGHADMGSSNVFLKELSTKSGMPIVGSGGYYRQLTYGTKIAGMSEDQLFDEFIKGARDERWGAFGELGTSDVMTLDEHKVFRAVGRASVATGLPIFTHTQNGKCAMEQLDALENVGVKPEKIVIGHTCCFFAPNPWKELHSTLGKRGVYVGFDRVGGERSEPDVERVKMVTTFIEEGYADQALFASDFTAKSSTKHEGGGGYGRVVTKFVPMVKQAGVDDKTLHGILVDNPRRFLAFVPKKA